MIKSQRKTRKIFDEKPVLPGFFKIGIINLNVNSGESGNIRYSCDNCVD